MADTPTKDAAGATTGSAENKAKDTGTPKSTSTDATKKDNTGENTNVGTGQSTNTPSTTNTPVNNPTTNTGAGVVPKTVSAYEHSSDVNVLISVVHPKPVIGLGNLLILNAVPGDSLKGDLSDKLSIDDRKDGILLRKTDKTTNAVYREYENTEAVAVDYDTNSNVFKKAQTYFAQKNHSDRVAVLDYDASKTYESLKGFWGFKWTLAIQSGYDLGDNAVSLTNIFENNKDHMLVLQTDDEAKFGNFYGQNYTIGLYHDTAEAMDAALVGAAATLTVGSITWKFKSLVGITPTVLTNTELRALNKDHAIAYIEVNGVGETSEGWTMSGEYIDSIHGIIWVSTNMGSKLESFLQENGKISYDQQGITRIQGVAIQVLEQAFQQGIIQVNEATGKGDYKVTVSPRSEQSAKDISDRHYGGLAFTYHVSGAIHSITVHGEVDSDTIMA